MAVMTYEENNYVKDGDVFIVKLLTDQGITMFYRCIYLDDVNKGIDNLLVFNFENHYPKDNIFIPCGEGLMNKNVVINAIKKRWQCDTEIEFIKNNNLMIKISKR
jgi:hypothetical protein